MDHLSSPLGGADGGTRTPTGLCPPGPKPGASANSATPAFADHCRRWPPRRGWPAWCGERSGPRITRGPRRGSPGTRTRNLRIKSPMLCQIELATRSEASSWPAPARPPDSRIAGAQGWLSSRIAACRPAWQNPGYGLWRSLVAHLLWEQGVAGSNPASPTGHRSLDASARASSHAHDGPHGRDPPPLAHVSQNHQM